METPSINCSECSSELDESWQSNDKNQIICVECFQSNYVECSDCSIIIHRNDSRNPPSNQNPPDSTLTFCERCYAANYSECFQCYTVIPSTEAFSIEFEGDICQTCYRQQYVRCYYCSDNILIEDSYCDNDGIHHCDRCHEEYYINCGHCQTEINRDNGYNFVLNGSRILGCRQCYNNSVTIHNYSYKPDIVFFKRSQKENLFFGIELEVERAQSKSDLDIVASKIKKPEFYFKSDGSLSHGFEIVSHPMSYEYIKHNNKLFSEMFEILNNEQYKSYESTTCGMHIHLNKNAFSTWHLYRFLDFFRQNRNLILQVSQRFEPFFRRWSDINDSEYSEKQIKNKAKVKNSEGSRYTAVNLTNSKTVEIRIFRGTLKYPTFMKNIEFTHSIYEFTKIQNSDSISKEEYLKFTKNYKYLNNFLKDKNLCV